MTYIYVIKILKKIDSSLVQANPRGLSVVHNNLHKTRTVTKADLGGVM